MTPLWLLPLLLLAWVTACGDRVTAPFSPPETGSLSEHGMGALASGSPLVVSQVYGGGGNAGAQYTHDFVEIFNRGTTAISLAGLSIQYASATGTGHFGSNANLVTELPNVSLAPGQYYLVQQAAGAGAGDPLPTPDVVDATPISLAAGAGKVALVTGTSSLGCNGGSAPCSAEQLARIVDLVGYGNADFFEGDGAAPTLTNVTAAHRASGGCTDTDNNAADFSAEAPAPRNTASPLNVCVALPVINEVVANHVGTDTHEYIEVFGSPNTDYSAYTVLQIEGDGTGAGIIDSAHLVGTTDASGFWFTGFLENVLENGTITLLLVKDFTGSVGDDLDTNNDGTLDVTPWSAIVDDVAISDGGAEDRTYSTTVLAPGFGGSAFTPGGASRIPNGVDTDSVDDWVLNDFDGEGLLGFIGTPDPGEALNTPGAANILVPTLPGCGDPFTPIYQIQGSGAATPLAGQMLTTQGVVIGDFEGPLPNLRGFYIQDPTGDGDSMTSDGVFVFNGNDDSVNLGDLVRVSGVAGEFQDQTQVSSVTAITVCATGMTITPTPLTLPFPAPTGGVPYLERYEGMLVTMPQTLYVTEHFQLGRFGQVVMSSAARLQQPTQVAVPGPAALALQDANDRNRIIIDDELNNQNPDPIRFGRGGTPLSASNTLRAGDTATGIMGVLTYTWAGSAASGDEYRVRPVNALGGGVPAFAPTNPRLALPEPVEGTLKIASFNLLNYFNTFAGCSAGVGGAPTDCRGAENSTEFNRQWPKTVAAILGLGVDVLGVMEMENDGYGPESAIQDLVDRLNAATGPGTFAFIDVDAQTGQANALGTDAIKVGLLYRPGIVTPVGATAVLNSAAFVNGGDPEPRNRPALAQAFQENASGGQFVVSVNHFKSKGSACSAPDIGDGQGECNGVRTLAANLLREWLAGDPTGTGDPDVLILGDLNSYAREDPVQALTGSGYTDLGGASLGPTAYAYVFDGQWGTLDYALATGSLGSQVTGVARWHINADEPSVLDYNTNFKSPGQQVTLYAPDPYRASDHDPLIVGVQLQPPYPFGGFLPPVAASPTFNVVRSGQSVPVKFSLGGDRGLDIFATGYPFSVPIACDAAAGSGPVEETAGAGQSGLSYDPETDTYTYVWKTARTWAGSCRELVIRFNDAGGAYRARFSFTR